MQILTIKDGAGYICAEDGQTISVLDVSVKDIERISNMLLDYDDASFDENTDDILNPAGKVIYEQLKKAFNELLGSREAILDHINEVYSEAEKKYLSTEQK